MASLTLYVDSLFLSPYAWSAYAALHNKAIDFDLVTVDLRAGGHRADPYAEMSMTQRVPMLVDNEEGHFALTESSAICEYLEDLYPPPEYWSIFPTGLENRARARQLMAWLRSDFFHLKAERPTECIFYDREVAPLSQAAQAEVDKLYAVVQKLLLPHNRCLIAPHGCLVDLEVAVMLQRLRKSGDPMPHRITEFAKEQWKFSGVQEWIRHHFRARDHIGLTPVPSNEIRYVPKSSGEPNSEPEPRPNAKPSLRLVPKPE